MNVSRFQEKECPSAVKVRIPGMCDKPRGCHPVQGLLRLDGALIQITSHLLCVLGLPLAALPIFFGNACSMH